MNMSVGLVQGPVVLIAVSAVAFATGCCNKNRGGSYADYSTPAYTGQSSSQYQAGSTNIEVPLYEESVQVGKREVEEGTVRLRKVVKTETVNQPVQIRREMLVIDRIPASGSTAATESQPFTEQQVVIQLKHEEPVVQTSVVQSGRVVAQTRYQVQETNIQRQIRREDIQIDKQGTGENVTISDSVAAGGGGQAGTEGRSTASATSAAITDPGMLSTNPDPSSLAGRTVQFSGARVERVLDEQNIMITGAGSKPICAHLQQPSPALKAGDTVNLTGTVKNLSDSAKTVVGLSDKASEAIKGQTIFIDAQNLEINP